MSNPSSTSAAVAGALESDNTSVSDESNLRYAAYANRFRTILLASHRYVAYTSDIGESFRPVAHPYLVSMGYAVSWMYLLGDVGYESWKVKMKSEGKYLPHLMPWDYPYPPPNLEAADLYKIEAGNSLAEGDWRVKAVKRGVFQGLASMALPAFTIHSAVRYSSIAFKNVKVKPVRTYGPVAVGLGIVPLLPYIFDEPVEHAVDWVFDKGEELYKNKLE